MFAFLSRHRPTEMTARDAVDKSRDGDVVVLDIRDGAEVAATGKAKGALHVPMAPLAMRCDPRSPEYLPELGTGKPIALYCASGARSAMAAKTLRRFGHGDGHNIGGLAHWQRAGGQIER